LFFPSCVFFFFFFFLKGTLAIAIVREVKDTKKHDQESKRDI